MCVSSSFKRILKGKWLIKKWHELLISDCMAV